MDPTNGSASGELDDAAEWRTRAPGGTEYSWLRAIPGGTGTTLLALRLSRGGVDAAKAALRSLRNAHPLLCAGIRTSPSGPTLAFPDRAPPLPLEPVPAPDSAPDFHALLEHELNRNPWADPVAPLAGGERGGPEDAAAEAALEDRIPQRDTWKPFWARGLDMVGYSINGLRTSTLPFVETGTERSTQMLRLGLGHDETTRLLDISSSMAWSFLLLCSSSTASSTSSESMGRAS